MKRSSLPLTLSGCLYAATLHAQSHGGGHGRGGHSFGGHGYSGHYGGSFGGHRSYGYRGHWGWGFALGWGGYYPWWDYGAWSDPFYYPSVGYGKYSSSNYSYSAPVTALSQSLANNPPPLVNSSTYVTAPAITAMSGANALFGR